MMCSKVSVTKIFTFDSAHRLNDYEGVCKNIHGHTYKLEVSVKGVPDRTGMVMDFHDLNDIVGQNIISRVDHMYLNEIFDFNPTCENIALWIWEVVESKLPGAELDRIILWETPTSYVTMDRKDLRGNDEGQ